MLPYSKVTEIYCMIDDSYKEFMVYSLSLKLKTT